MGSAVPTPSPFLECPREVRDMIYKNIVIADDAVNMKSRVSEDNAALFRVSKKIHEEATEVFYEQNTFFVPQTFFRFGKPLQSVPTARLLCGLNATRLGMVRSLDVEMPVAHSATKTKDRKVLAKFKTFVKILATYSSPQLQLRFLGGVKLIRLAEQLVASFSCLAAFGWAAATLNMQAIWHAAMDDRWGGLQMMLSALRIIREYCGTVRWHVFVMVHPVLLCQAREALISHNIPSYLLQSRLDRPPVLWNTVREVLETFGMPVPSATTAQRLAKEYFLECPLNCLKRENAWVWRLLPGHSAAFASTRASLE